MPARARADGADRRRHVSSAPSSRRRSSNTPISAARSTTPIVAPVASTHGEIAARWLRSARADSRTTRLVPATSPAKSAAAVQRPHDRAHRQDLRARRLARELRHVAVGRADDQLLGACRPGSTRPSRMMAMRSASRIASSKSWVMKTIVFCRSVLQPQELVLHLAADQRIERRERLVEEPELRPDRERAGDADALLLAAGKLARQILLAPAAGPPARSSPARAPRAPRARRPGSRAGRRRCAARRDAAAARNAGTPCPCGGAGARSARARRRRAGRGRRTGSRRRVGSTSRDRQRTSVDLPEPERPMMTKISPARMSS